MAGSLLHLEHLLYSEFRFGPREIQGIPSHLGSIENSCRQDPGASAYISSTFVHAACSGNNVNQTINSLRSARGRLPRIDVLLVSVGANEVNDGFGNLLTRCILEFNGPCSEDEAFAAQLASDIAGLHAKYESLASSIACLRSSS